MERDTALYIKFPQLTIQVRGEKKQKENETKTTRNEVKGIVHRVLKQDCLEAQIWTKNKFN